MRYVDDSFLLFKDISHILLFQNYLNKIYPNIKFTCEYEFNRTLSFLECSVLRENNKFEISTQHIDSLSRL